MYRWLLIAALAAGCGASSAEVGTEDTSNLINSVDRAAAKKTSGDQASKTPSSSGPAEAAKATSSSKPSEASKPANSTDPLTGFDNETIEGEPPASLASAKLLTSLDDVDTSALSSDNKARYKKLLKSLVSPCGKAHSLLKSASKGCKRAPYAAKLVAMLLSQTATDAQIREFYADRYVGKKLHRLTGDGIRFGSARAKVQIVEFFDYLCGHCKAMQPAMDAVKKRFGADLSVVYKVYPLWPESTPVGQAAMAAAKQGKAEAMHKKIFDAQDQLKSGGVESRLKQFAKAIGLDMRRYRVDFAAAKVAIEGFDAEGKSVDVKATPTLFVNGRKYNGPQDPGYLGDWIAEELAVATP